MVVGLDGEGFETTLVKVAGTGGVVMGVPSLGVSQGQPRPHLPLWRCPPFANTAETLWHSQREYGSIKFDANLVQGA
jgi:hypothetical protein